MIQRIDWDEYFMDIATQVSRRCTCTRRIVGAVLVRDKHILATGYNGSASGQVHCSDVGCRREQLGYGHGEGSHVCLAGSTKLKLLSGVSIRIEDLVGKEVYGYAYDASTGRTVPVLIKNVRLTKYAKVIRLNFTDGTHIIVTADHLLLLRNNTYKKAGELQIGVDELMPARWRKSINPWFVGYEEIYHPTYPSGCGNKQVTQAISVVRYLKSNNIVCTPHTYEAARSSVFKGVSPISTLLSKGRIIDFDHLLNIEQSSIGLYELTHITVGKYILGDIKNNIVHHIDHNKINNEPSNLQLMSSIEHRTHHFSTYRHPDPDFYTAISQKGHEAFKLKLRLDPEFAKSVSQRGKVNMTKNWQNEEFKDKMKEVQSSNGRNTAAMFNKDEHIIKKRTNSLILKGISNLLSKDPLLSSLTYEESRKKNTIRKKEGQAAPTYDKILSHFNSVSEAIDKAKDYNHCLESVEYIDIEVPVYDFEVEGFENCIVDLGNDTGVYVHNCRAIHAEQNALIQCAIHGILTPGSTLYCTAKPCFICAKMLVNARVSRIVCIEGREDKYTDELFESVGMQIEYYKK